MRNGGWDGFCAELAEKIADLCNFNFRIDLVKDGKYGAREDNGTWNGMVGELIRKVRCACVADVFCFSLPVLVSEL